jgi:dihydrodipicolinate synthase/N-acetylneuraminate lyase
MGKLIRGIVPALCTPFDEDGELAVDRVPPLIRSLLDAGVVGFFVCGSTGEGKGMTVPERKQMGEAAVREVGGAVPVMLHVGGTSTDNAVELARHAASIGADATASVAPIDAPNNLAAAVKHYAAIGAATDLPFYLYWMADAADPSATAEQFLDAMKPVRNFAGFKFTDKNFYLFQRLVDCSGGTLNAVTGPDEMCVAGMAMGSDGAIGSTYNIMPRLVVGMYDAFHSGEISSAMEAQVKVNRVLSLLFRVGVLAAIKAILGWRGTPVGEPRPPTPRLSAEGCDELKRALDTFDFEVA